MSTLQPDTLPTIRDPLMRRLVWTCTAQCADGLRCMARNWTVNERCHNCGARRQGKKGEKQA